MAAFRKVLYHLKFVFSAITVFLLLFTVCVTPAKSQTPNECINQSYRLAKIRCFESLSQNAWSNTLKTSFKNCENTSLSKRADCYSNLNYTSLQKESKPNKSKYSQRSLEVKGNPMRHCRKDEAGQYILLAG